MDRRRAVSILLPLAVWWVAAMILGDPRLPPPTAVLARMATEIAQGPLLFHLGMTMLRVAAGFAIALTLGGGLGLVMGRNQNADRLLDGTVMFFLNVPALVVIILAYLWLGLGEAAAIIAVAINKIPHVAITFRQGARDLDPALRDMALVFRLDRWTRMRHVVAPQLAPYALVAARSGLALIWKIVLVVELLGRPNGIGFEMHVMFQMFDVTGLLAYGLAFVGVVQTIELLIFVPMEKRRAQWS